MTAPTSKKSDTKRHGSAVADKLIVRGAREHNLKDVSVELPRDALIVFTGLSGSGKSSLAFDTIFAENNIPVIEVSDYTGFPEMLDGRVKTLHPKIHGGILGKRDDEKHLETMNKFNIPLIDLVVVNLYPFEATISKENCQLSEAIENIDTLTTKQKD